MLDFLRYDFGYSWPITRGHLIVFLVFASAAALCYWRGWSRWITAITSVVAVWALAASLVMHHVIRINSPVTLSTADIRRLIRAAGRLPVERDTLYNVVTPPEADDREQTSGIEEDAVAPRLPAAG